jgi:hypothetical protein
MMGKVMCIITVGIDLAKNILAVHGVNEGDKAKFRFQHTADNGGSLFSQSSAAA